MAVLARKDVRKPFYVSTENAIQMPGMSSGEEMSGSSTQMADGRQARGWLHSETNISCTKLQNSERLSASQSVNTAISTPVVTDPMSPRTLYSFCSI
jgi:hypothetical protein